MVMGRGRDGGLFWWVVYRVLERHLYIIVVTTAGDSRTKLIVRVSKVIPTEYTRRVHCSSLHYYR